MSVFSDEVVACRSSQRALLRMSLRHDSTVAGASAAVAGAHGDVVARVRLEADGAGTDSGFVVVRLPALLAHMACNHMPMRSGGFDCSEDMHAGSSTEVCASGVVIHRLLRH